MKKILMLAAVLSLAGCGAADRIGAAITGGGSETCVGGVKYLQFASGVTVKYTPEGKIATCNK